MAPLFASTLFLAAAFSLPAFADATQSAGESFGHQIVDHQADIAPFLQKHQGDIYRMGAPGFDYIVLNIFGLNLLVGWIVDFAAAYVLSQSFAPTYALLKQAGAFATGHLLLIAAYSVLSLFLFFTIGSVMPLIVFEAMIVLLLLIVTVLQTILVSVCYRTSEKASVQFYAAVFAVHVLALAFFFPITKARTATMMSALANQVATPTLNAYIGERKQLLTVAENARDKVKV